MDAKLTISNLESQIQRESADNEVIKDFLCGSVALVQEISHILEIPLDDPNAGYDLIAIIPRIRKEIIQLND